MKSASFSEFMNFVLGTLHIAAILPSDDGVTFQCVANNEIIREQTTGPRYKIMASYPEVGDMTLIIS